MRRNGTDLTTLFIRFSIALFGVVIVTVGVLLAFGIVARNAVFPYGGAASAIAVVFGVVLIYVSITETVR